MKFKVGDIVKFTRPDLKWSIEKQSANKIGKVIGIRNSNYTYDIEVLFEGDLQSVYVKNNQLNLVIEEPAGIEHTQQEVPIEEYEQDEPQVGVKFDQDKPMLSILTKGCPRALMAVGQALTYGAKKYGESPDKLNFLDVPNGFNRYSDAMIRHHLQESLEDLDESGLEPIVLTTVNALFRLEIYLREKENGSRKDN